MNPLTDLLPAKARKAVYAILSVAAYLYALWQASNGDWKQFVAAVITGLISTLATANTGTSGITQCPDPGVHDPLLGTGGE